ncbi:MAG: YceI family protein, partial [Candidatus Omnitrophica bacterium]|nr:YceI family protein [Candidatus Omnitrophota bacterium]
MKHFTFCAFLAVTLLTISGAQASEKGSMKGSDTMMEKGSMTPSAVKHYEIDAAHSTLGFSVKHLGIGITRGSFGTFEGNITMDPNDLSSFAAIATIDAGSIDTKNEGRD